MSEPLPRIGDQAPDFTAQTTQGEITLSTWQEGKWVVLYSHPGNFTPKEQTDFEQRGVKLIGISVDSARAVSELYGMIQSDAVSALFVIDPKRVVRAQIYYSLDVGRNVDEILRVIDALQAADKNGVACPVDGKPGEKDVADRLAVETRAET